MKDIKVKVGDWYSLDVGGNFYVIRVETQLIDGKINFVFAEINNFRKKNEKCSKFIYYDYYEKLSKMLKDWNMIKLNKQETGKFEKLLMLQELEK